MTNRMRGHLALTLLVSAIQLGVIPTEAKAQPKLDLSADEKAVLDLTNESRAKEKVEALKPDAILCQVARAHAANLAKKGALDHVVDGKNPADRARDGGYKYTWIGENIAAGDRWTPQKTFQVWMDSPVHKTNILADKFTEIGLGVAKADNGVIYYVQVFASPR